MIKEKVVVGMSGGVDSSVTAYLLKKQGYDVVGITMKTWEGDKDEAEDTGTCCGFSAIDDARRVANHLEIPYYVLNFKDIFKETVIDYFVEDYLKGKTPNPCIACNRFVKWDALLQRSLQISAKYIATGHYAQVCKYPETNRYTLKLSQATGKDQTYALYNLTQFQLQHTLMPLWEYEKSQVREFAKEAGLLIADKPDSQEICFVTDNDYSGFIKKYTKTNVPVPVGNYIDINGNVLGQHEGIINYTVGQRKGLGMTFGKPMYVKSINAETNNIVLCEDKDLFTTRLLAENINFMAIESLESEMEVMGKIRYSHKPQKCKIKMVGDYLECEFETPQRAVTPGQAVVFYKDDYVICGGTIS